MSNTLSIYMSVPWFNYPLKKLSFESTCSPFGSVEAEIMGGKLGAPPTPVPEGFQEGGSIVKPPGIRKGCNFVSQCYLMS